MPLIHIELEDLEAIRNEKKELEEEYDCIDSQLDDANETIQELRVKIQEIMEDGNENSKKALEEKDKEIKSLTKQLENWQNHYDEAGKQIDWYRNKYLEGESIILKKNSEIEALKKQLENKETPEPVEPAEKTEKEQWQTRLKKCRCGKEELIEVRVLTEEQKEELRNIEDPLDWYGKILVYSLK